MSMSRILFPSWNITAGNAYTVNDGRACVEARFDDGMWTLEEFSALVAQATEGWDDVSICWQKSGYDGQEASFWIRALRDLTPEDEANIRAWKERELKNLKSEHDYAQRKIAELERDLT